MAVRIPLIVDYNGKGLDRLKREFAQLDGIAAKSAFVLKKAWLPATAALGGLAVAATDATKAALQDQAAQEILAKVIRETTAATDDQIASVEDWITAQGRLLGVADDDLRPAYAKLVRVTRDNTKAQKFAALAMDVAAGTGKDLGEVTDAFSKALGGNLRSLRSLSPELTQLIKDGATADQVMIALADTFGGAAAVKADTAAGRMEILKVRFGELKEEIGAALIPIIERYLLPALEAVTSWLEENPDKIQRFIGLIGDLARAFVDAAKFIGEAFMQIKNVVVDVINFVIDQINYFANKLDQVLGPFINIGEISRIPTGGSAAPATSGVRLVGSGDDRINRMLRGEAGARAQISSNVLAGMGRLTPGMVTAPGGVGPVLPAPNMTINVSGGDPRAVVDALVRWSRQNGALPSTIRTR
jgi:hypothetical protein